MPASIEAFTFRKGLLARLGHDVCLSAERFVIELEAGKLHAEVFASSLRVRGAMHDGKLDPGALSASDRAEIERAIQREVLHSDKHPKLSLLAEARVLDANRFALQGRLELHGRSEPLQIEGRLSDGRLHAELELRPSRFGVEPYRALGGALKLEDRVKVSVRLPVPEALAQLDASQLVTATARWSAGEPA